MSMRNLSGPHSALIRTLDSHSERERLANAMGISTDEISAFSQGEGTLSLAQFLSLLDAASIEVVKADELAAIERFAAQFLRDQLDARR